MRSGTCRVLKLITNVSVPFLIYAVISWGGYLTKNINRMENEKELTLMPYGNHNGIVIYCKNCGSEFEETAEGYYPPIKYESDKHNRYCRRCLTELGTFS